MAKTKWLHYVLWLGLRIGPLQLAVWGGRREGWPRGLWPIFQVCWERDWLFSLCVFQRIKQYRKVGDWIIERAIFKVPKVKISEIVLKARALAMTKYIDNQMIFGVNSCNVP